MVSLVLTSSAALAADVSYVNGRAPGDSGPPFSGAVMVDDTLYVSGALGLVDGKVPEDPADEARAVLDSIKGSLEAAGMTMDDIVVVRSFVPMSPTTAFSTRSTHRISPARFRPALLSVRAICSLTPDLK